MKDRDVFFNENIRARQIRLVDEEGKQIGIFLSRDAVTRAKREGLDLIQIGSGDTPVCRIGDGGKFLFNMKRNQKEAARRQRELNVEVKEIQLRPVTDTHDIKVKSKRAQEFLNEGDKVKIVVRFRGRERTHKELARKVVDEFLSMMGDHKIEKELTDTGKDMQMLLGPPKTKSDIFREKNEA